MQKPSIMLECKSLAKPKLPVVKKSVSFRQDVFDTAEEMADKFFGGNFSAYLTYLVCADKVGVSRTRDSAEEAVVKEEIKEDIGNYVKSDANDDYIDQFIKM